jgi:hypothetical protein
MAEDENETPGLGGLESGGAGKQGELDTELPPPPPFMLDAPPASGKKMDMIKWALMHGKSEEEIVEAGYNKKTVSMAAYDLDKEGYRKRPPKSRARKSVETGKEVVQTSQKGVATYGQRALTGQTKNLPPEFLIDNIHLPLDGSAAKNFELGLKFGASMLVLGVRVAQELGNMGMQQVNPIIAMATAMRAGEAAAAKESAAEAAMLAAEEVGDKLMPVIASLRTKDAATTDPMRKMMTDMMQPMMQRIMGMFMPAMGGQADSVPQGWTRRQEE